MAGTPATDEVVGRDDQLRSFERVLESARPAFVLVTGHVGSGKSRLLREMRARARALGWRTVPPPDEPGLVVTRDATPQSFSRQVREMLADGADDPAIDAYPIRDARALSRGIAASSLTPHPPAPVAGDEIAAALIAAMRDACPALVGVDGFRPNAAFARWLSDQLLPAVKESGLPVIATLTMETEPPAEVLRHVDERFHLGRLDEAATERYFRRLGERLNPPMGEEELRAYVRAAAARPELVHSLRRVLALAERPGR
jgi:AAA ATPase domain